MSSTDSLLPPGIYQYGSVGSVPDDDEVVTTRKHEAKWLIKSATPVSVAFMLQLSLTTISLFTVGKLGKVELASMSLCIVLVAVVGYGMFQGAATSIDTLAAQAFGRKDYQMVGVWSLRCTILLWITSIPIAIIWMFPHPLLRLIGPEEEVIANTAMCMRLMVIDLPSYALNEVFRHYFQVQGIFHAGTCVLLISTPINMVLNYFLVLSPTTGYGLAGAPVAIVITDYFTTILSIGYAYFFTDRKCFPDLSVDLFSGWKPMLKLAIPGAIMYEAEWLAFEIVTIASSRLGTTVMAAQSIIGNICSLAFQIPLSLGLAASTRTGNLIGSRSIKSVKIASRVAVQSSSVTAIFNASTMYLLRYQLGAIFSNDADVIQVVAATIPYAAVFQLSDSLNCVTGGILRGQGRQFIGGVLNVIFYYVLAIPLAFFAAFVLKEGLVGLWVGLVLGLSCVAILQMYFVLTSNWKRFIENQLTDFK
ncbi:ethionine resistance-conferring protein 1 [Trichomonascus vanleenenianus]|uniref:MATE family efflux transporter n=1 Tax=Trichomonascus vanleenenianus TaxID=2268995 RepID=UPI003ECB6A70